MRSRGMRHAFRQLSEKYLFASQTWVIFRNDLNGSLPENCTDGIVFRPFVPTDAILLSSFEPHHRASALLTQVNEGCWLDLALDEGRAVAFRIVSPCGPRHPPFARIVKLQPDQVWVVDLFCLPAYRARGIGTRLAVRMDQRLATLGYREVILANRANNVATVRLSIRKRNQFLFWFSYRRVLFYVRYQVSTDMTEVARWLDGTKRRHHSGAWRAAGVRERAGDAHQGDI